MEKVPSKKHDKRCVWKVTGQVSQTIYFNSIQLHGFPFKLITLYFTFPSHFYELIEGFFWDAPQLHHYSSPGGFDTFKTGPLDDPFELGKNKNHLEQNQVNREVVPVQPCSSQLEIAECSAHPVPFLFRHAQIFGDNFPSTALSGPADLQSFEWSTYYHHAPTSLTT